MNRWVAVALVAAGLAAGCSARTGPAPASKASTAPPASTTMTTTTTTEPPAPSPAVVWLGKVCTELQAIPIGVAPPKGPVNTLDDLKREGIALIDVARTPLAALVTDLNRLGPPPDPALAGAYADLRRPLDGLLGRLNAAVSGIRRAQTGEQLDAADEVLNDLGTTASNTWSTALQSVRLDPLLQPLAEQTTTC